jgi:hypothetical protein
LGPPPNFAHYHLRKPAVVDSRMVEAAGVEMPWVIENT